MEAGTGHRSSDTKTSQSENRRIPLLARGCVFLPGFLVCFLAITRENALSLLYEHPSYSSEEFDCFSLLFLCVLNNSEKNETFCRYTLSFCAIVAKSDHFCRYY